MTPAPEPADSAGTAVEQAGPPVPAHPAAGWRESKWLTVGEFAAVALVFVADRWHLIPLSTTPFLLLIGWVALRLRGVGWRGVGLKRYRAWYVTLGLGAAAGALLEAFQLGVTEPLLVRLTGVHPDLSKLPDLKGKVLPSLVALAFVWAVAAFGEEMVYRGYLLNRVADLGNRTRLAWIFSVVAVNALFGYGHRYQGVTGAVEEGVAGLLLSLVYLGTGRNLWVPIVAHGTQDTLDVVMLFLGIYPYP
jgi:membrane protease YdiL (CAAX protease family)